MAIQGLDHECAASMDNILTIPANLLGRTVGFLHADQERSVAVAMVFAFDLDLNVLSA